MSRHISKTLATVTLNATSSAIFDLDLDTISNLQILVDCTYAGGTTSPTGLNIDLKGGFGGGDTGITGSVYSLSDPAPFGITVDGTSPTTVPVFSDNVESINVVPHTVNQGGSTRTKTFFYINDVNKSWPRWLRVIVYNKDTAKQASITFRLDI